MPRYADRVLRLWFPRLLAILLALVAVAGAQPARAQLADLAYRKAPVPAGAPAEGWRWVEVSDVAALRGLPAGWRLLVDQTRFRAIRIEARTAAGTIAIERRADQLAPHAATGNYLQFRMPVPGARVEALRIGYRGMPNPGLMRSIKAGPEQAFVAHEQRWSMLIALVGGVLVCALAYNLFLLTWMRPAFQRLYVAWLSLALAYALTWSGLLAWIVPAMVGPAPVRLSYVLISGLIGTGALFFLALIEPGKLPPRLVRLGRASATAVILLGFAAAADPLIPAPLSDRLLNIGFLACIACNSTGIVIAIRRRSRAVWFYLAGWTPPLTVLALRVSRNFGLMPKSELVDMASFAAIAFEAIVLSLAIADRFRALRRAHDAAEVERATLERLATTDPLTGLGNRLAFQRGLAALADDPHAKLILIDVDYLKQVNDSAGHEVGDALLVAAAQHLKAAVGNTGHLMRIGGDEFAVLLPGDARHLAPALLAAVAQSGEVTIAGAGRRFALSLSAGAASGLPAAELQRAADLALYRAKAEGRGQWRRFDPALGETHAADRQLCAEAAAGLPRGEFVLHYQPVVELASGRTVAHEALLRWTHPRRGTLTPGRFEPVLQEPGLADLVHAEVLRLALDRLATADGAAPARLAINLSANQLADAGMPAGLLAELAGRGLPPERLTVEVTESVVLGRGEGKLVAGLKQLHRAGVRIALDDFGTGFASLIHLRQLPIDVLKIDRSFVAGLGADDESRAIVHGMVGLAHSLGKTVIAEGVETPEQLAQLTAMGCDAAQGFLLGRPEALPAATGPGRRLAA